MRNLRIRFGHLILLAIGFVAILMISFFWIGYEEKPKKGFHQDYVYKTWKLKKLYQNGKSVEREPKFSNLKLKVNRDGTAEWIRPDSRLTMSFKVINDGTQIIIDDGYTLEDIETIFELSEEKFRFGKRNIASKYEYIMIPAND